MFAGVRITIEIDDEELQRALAPVVRSRPMGDTVPARESRLLTVHEVADRLRLSRSKVYELIANGTISSVTIGRSRRIEEAAIVALAGVTARGGDGQQPPTGVGRYRP